MPTRYSYGDSGNIGKFTETGALYARLFMTDGRRVKRGNVEFVYDDSGNLVKSDGMEFCYDESGVTGVKYNNKEYVYRKDEQGNIIACRFVKHMRQ